MAEADVDDEGLDLMIAQRNQRPSFARMISLEFREPKSPKRHRRRSKRQSGDSCRNDRDQVDSNSDADWTVDLGSDSNDDEEGNLFSSPFSTVIHTSLGSENTFLKEPDPDHEDDTSSEESLYFSAAEEVIESDSSGSDKSLTCLLLGEKLTGDHEDSDSVKNNTDEDDDVFKETCKTLKKPNHQRAPSKKQKRKKRKHYGNHIKPFLCLDFDINSDIVDLQSSTCAASIGLSREIPSLVELCIKSVDKSCADLLPSGMKHLFEYSYVNDSFRKFQLTWMHGVLAQLEPKENFVKKCMFKTEISFPSTNPSKKSKIYNKTAIEEFLLPTRNTWNLKFYPKYDHKAICNYSGNIISCLVPSLYMMDNIYIAPRLPKINEEHRLGFQVLAVLASTLDLMMPAMLGSKSTRRRRLSSAASSSLSQTNTTVLAVITQLKYVMNRRFPTVVERCFDTAVPYVFWARGDIEHATHYFTELSQKQSEGRMKALYLNEIGRMHAQLGETETASRFYQSAACVVQDNLLHYHHADQVNTQMLMLLANTYDQGLLTLEKGKLSAAAWMSVVTSPYQHKTDNLPLYIMDTYLCTHCGKFEAGKSREWLEEAKSRILSLSKVKPDLLYYLSMVHALLGESKESHQTYWQFFQEIQGGPKAPGYEVIFMSDKGRKANPWHLLIQTVTKMASPPRFLSVVWRTQLLSLCTANQSFPVEADLCNKPLYLRLDADGNITGDLQMFLPPIRAISLNPYTGMQLFHPQPSRTEVWESVECYNDCYLQPGHFFTPTLKEIRGSSPNPGFRIHLCMGNKFLPFLGNFDNNIDFCHLIWTGENGEKAKLNVIKKMKNIVFKKRQETLKTTRKMAYYPATWKEDMFTILRYRYEHGYNMISQTIRNEAIEFGKRKKAAKDKVKELQSKGEKVPKSVSNMAEGNTINFIKPDPFKIFVDGIRLNLLEDTLFFLVLDGGVHYLLKIDCSSKTSFLTPLIEQKIVGRGNSTVINERDGCIKEATSAFFVLNNTTLEMFTIDDENKKTLYVDQRNTTVIDIRPLEFIVSGKIIYGVGIGKRIWTWNGDELYEYAETENINALDLLDKVMLIRKWDSVSFYLVPTHFKDNLKILKVKLSSKYTGNSVSISEDEEQIKIRGNNVVFKMMREQRETRDGKQVFRAAVAIDNVVVVLLVPVITDDMIDNLNDVTVKVLMSVELPGFANDVCFISQQAGILINWTQHKENSDNYREHIFQFDYDTNLIGVLPFLGKGPRSFLPIYLPGDSELGAKCPGFGQSGWYVYMRDGHNGIIGVKANPANVR